MCEGGPAAVSADPDQTPPGPPQWAKPPELPAETVTGVHRALKHDLNWQGAKLTIAMVVVAISTAFAGYWKIIGDARAQAVDAGLVTKGQADATQRELERYQHESGNRLDRLEAGQGRTDAKLDAVLSAMRVPNPAPAPKDGGK